MKNCINNNSYNRNNNNNHHNHHICKFQISSSNHIISHLNNNRQCHLDNLINKIFNINSLNSNSIITVLIYSINLE